MSALDLDTKANSFIPSLNLLINITRIYVLRHCWASLLRDIEGAQLALQGSHGQAIIFMSLHVCLVQQVFSSLPRPPFGKYMLIIKLVLH